MIQRNKKYKTQGETAYPHMGAMLKKHITDNRVNRAAIARSLNVSQSAMKSYLDRESLQMGIVWKLSLALKYNFVGVLFEQLPIPYETKKEAELQQLLDEKTKAMEKLEIELAVYKKIAEKA